MAYDKIIVIHARLDKRINYVLNPEKTDRLDNGQVLQAAINCRLDTANADMMDTKRRWDKENRQIQGYHIIHSFAPGEVTPEQAFQISSELADRLLKGRHEAVISVHTDHDHIHAHIVFNSVSCVDGKMYRDDFKAYYRDLRGISNELSRKYGLSVIEPGGKGKQYAEWAAEKGGKPTIRSLIRDDIDACITEAVSMQTLYASLERMGYTVKHGAKLKYAAVKPPGAKRFIRLDSLGAGYTEADIRYRLSGSAPVIPESIPYEIRHRRYRIKRGTVRQVYKRGRFERLYLHYLYLLSPPRKRRYTVPLNVRAEVRKLDQYKRQFALLHKYHIDNESQCRLLADALQSDIDSLVLYRRELYRRRQRGEEVSAEIAQITASLRPIRRELRCCNSILEKVPVIREQVKQCRDFEQLQEKSRKKEVKEHGNER